MEQSELGKTEEHNHSSAELSEQAMADAPQSADEPVAVDAAPATEDSTPNPPADNSTPAAVVDVGYKRGELVDGVIVSTSPTSITIQLANGREGIIPNSELERMDVKRLEDFVVGKPLKVVVVNPYNRQGQTILSYTLALEELDWLEAASYQASKEIYHSKISGYNKGGLIVRFGRLRGFLPHSQISETRLAASEGETPEQRYTQMINQPISVKVMEVDRDRNRLILSERAAMREVRQQRKSSLINELKVGEEREGTVVSLENFGAFVDIGGAEGLVHVTEITHKHITHPNQALKVGQKVRVRVINIDSAKNRIGLSIKALESDPWDEVVARYQRGMLVRGTITKLTKFGAFARIEGDDDQEVEGLIHISELSDERVEHPSAVVKRGDVLTLRVIKLDVAEKRLGLSIKQVNSAEFLDEDLAFAFEHPDRVAIPTPAPTTTSKREGAPLKSAPASGVSTPASGVSTPASGVSTPANEENTPPAAANGSEEN